MATVFRAKDVTEAQIVCGLLQSRGIAASVDGYFLQGGVGELPASDFAAVSVPPEYADAARRLVQQYERGTLSCDEEDDCSE